MKKQKNDLTVVVLAAGKGTRMKSDTPKVLHKVGGLPLIDHVLKTLKALKPSRTIVVTGHGADAVESHVKPMMCVRQVPQQGTGHAVQVALKKLGRTTGDVLVIFGDTPFISDDTLQQMLHLHRIQQNGVTVLGFYAADPARYGRLVEKDGQLLKIVEFADATAEERAIDLCNAGVMLLSSDAAALVSSLQNKNKQKEYLLTDMVALAIAKGLTCGFAEAMEEEVMGINSRFELALAESRFQDMVRRGFLEGGVTLIDPATVYFSHDTKVGSDVVIEPNVFFGLGVVVESGVIIKAFSHVEGAHLKKGAVVGPFARLRPQTVIGEDVRVGNFVEIKKSVIRKGAKVPHLTYIGDADVGEKANVGAGTITCNYDGKNKHKTTIGAGAFIGSNTALVAPVKVGKHAIIGAGSVITENIKDGALALSRPEQKNFKSLSDYKRSKKKK